MIFIEMSWHTKTIKAMILFTTPEQEEKKVKSMSKSYWTADQWRGKYRDMYAHHLLAISLRWGSKRLAIFQPAMLSSNSISNIVAL